MKAPRRGGWRRLNPGQARKPKPRRCGIGFWSYARRRTGNCEVEFDRSLELDSQSFWANLSRGVCAFRREQFEDAAASFGVCVALAPHRAEYFYNRALAWAAAGRTERAARDYDRALELDPNCAEAALNRGLLRYQEKRYAEVLGDIQRALAAGADPGAGYYALALIYPAREEDVRARASLEAGLRSNPDSKEEAELYDQLGGASPPSRTPPSPGKQAVSSPSRRRDPSPARSGRRRGFPHVVLTRSVRMITSRGA
jgi:tetratricopeptide (TPR) repeat protein